MRFASVFAGLLVLAAPLAAQPDVPITYAQPDVAEQNGNVVYYDRLGKEHPLTREGRNIQPRLSPDGKTAVFIRVEREGQPGYGDARSSLWLADIATAKPRLLLASTPADDVTQNLAAMWNPQFSADGKAVYVMAEAWVTTPAIHRIDMATARHRFITDGELLGIIANGRHRGELIVRKRRYLPGPDYGTDNPVYVLSPDGRRSQMIPGSARDDSEAPVERWLKARQARRL